MDGLIQVDEHTRIRRVDSMNWTVELLKDSTKRDGTTERRWDQANGRGFGPFANRPGSRVIVECLLANATELNGFEGTLAEYTKAVEKAGARIAVSITELSR